MNIEAEPVEATEVPNHRFTASLHGFPPHTPSGYSMLQLVVSPAPMSESVRIWPGPATAHASSLPLHRDHLWLPVICLSIQGRRPIMLLLSVFQVAAIACLLTDAVAGATALSCVLNTGTGYTAVFRSASSTPPGVGLSSTRQKRHRQQPTRAPSFTPGHPQPIVSSTGGDRQRSRYHRLGREGRDAT